MIFLVARFLEKFIYHARNERKSENIERRRVSKNFFLEKGMYVCISLIFFWLMFSSEELVYRIYDDFTRRIKKLLLLLLCPILGKWKINYSLHRQKIGKILRKVIKVYWSAFLWRVGIDWLINFFFFFHTISYMVHCPNFGECGDTKLKKKINKVGNSFFLSLKKLIYAGG